LPLSNRDFSFYFHLVVLPRFDRIGHQTWAERPLMTSFVEREKFAANSAKFAAK
jgi:hypothetical protein